MTREEHLEWAKNRALEYVDLYDLPNALASMLSDLSKHPELQINETLAAAGLRYAMDRDRDGVRRWIEDLQ